MKLDELISQIKEKGTEATKTIHALLDQYGGIHGFIAAMKEKGVPENVKTWVHDGKELVMTNEQVKKILGDERVKQIAEKLSTTPEKITQTLAQVLPPVLEKIEKLAPGGKIPEGNWVGKILGKVKSLLEDSASQTSSEKTASNTKKENSDSV